MYKQKYLICPLIFVSKAGLASPSNHEQIIIALEPEAASVYCREREMREFVTESGNSDALVADILAHTAKHYVVVDIGGTVPEIFSLLIHFPMHP